VLQLKRTSFHCRKKENSNDDGPASLYGLEWPKSKVFRSQFIRDEKAANSKNLQTQSKVASEHAQQNDYGY